MSNVQHFYLIPGFFGFADLGGITYFHHVREVITELCKEHDIEPRIYYVSTYPTGSIRKRALKLYEQIVETAGQDDHPINLIGHSTGGLDARLFTTPTVALLKGVDVEPFASRVKNVVTISTPHLGTPMASFFDSLLGQRLLYLLSMGTVYALRFGKFPLSAMFQIVGMFTRLDDFLGFKNTILDQFYDNLFADFEYNNIGVITEYLESVRTEQVLLGQLTTGGMDLFNAVCEDRPGTRYGSVITQGRRPSLEVVKEMGVDPYRQASHAVYQLVYRLTGRVPEYPDLSADDVKTLKRAYGELPERDASDGVVPTWSQVYGEVIHACWADHLDVCGHFSDERHHPPHIDWLASGTRYNRTKFMHLWEDVIEYIAQGK